MKNLTALLIFAVLFTANVFGQGDKIKDDFDNNFNLFRFFRLVNSLNDEADKQAAKGFTKRAEAVRNYFQKKTGISDGAKIKLKEISKSFLTEVKNASKENRNKAYDKYRKSLRDDLSKDDFDRALKFLSEQIIGKSKTKGKSIPIKNLFRKTSWFGNTVPNSPQSGTEIEGYSFITYDPGSNELWGASFTDGSCIIDNGEHEEEDRCAGSHVHARIDDPLNILIVEDDGYGVGGSAEIYLYGSAEQDGQHCIYAEHEVEGVEYTTASTVSNDCVEVELDVATPQISSVVFEAKDSPLDENPGNGQRIFPDKTAPVGDNMDRRTVRVNATVFPATPNLTVYFRAIDVDDPSSDPIIDSNGSAGADNKGLVDGMQQGRLSGISDETDGYGTATVDFTVTMQPGDNFVVQASTDPNFNSGIVQSGMLTVWRRLHIEVDSMGEVENFVTGSTTANNRIKSNQTVTINTNLIGLEENRFERGRVVFINGISLPVTGNTDHAITVQNFTGTGINIGTGTQFQLFDDDDYNEDDGLLGDGTLDGDIFENIEEIPLKTFSMMRDSSSITDNAFAAAYIQPEYDWAAAQGYNQSNINFSPNVNYDLENQAETQLLYSYLDTYWESYVEYDDFWTAYIFLAYQPQESQDQDPDTEDTHGGDTFSAPGNVNSVPLGPFPQGANISLIYLETDRDIDNYEGVPEFEISTTAHEVGHQMGLDGDVPNYGIMSSGENLVFVPEHINMLRTRVHSPGYLEELER